MGLSLNFIDTTSIFTNNIQHTIPFNSTQFISIQCTHIHNNNNNNNNVSYWVAPLLQTHQPCSGSNEDDAQLGEWTYHWLEEIVQKHSSGTASSH
mmetsp:Transcript_6180/g.7190  ORF Transcript_6180/g.7190 Transcript_6180/m.7190 type:complete len:95 (-) Transcript_6180:197-481(-)